MMPRPVLDDADGRFMAADEEGSDPQGVGRSPGSSAGGAQAGSEPARGATAVVGHEVKTGADHVDEQASAREAAQAQRRHRKQTIRYVISRVLRAVFTIFVVATGTFFLVRLLPSSPDRKSTRLNSSHVASSYAVFCLTKTTAERPSRRPG